MNLDPALLLIVAAVIAPTNLALNLLSMTVEGLGDGQKLIAGYVIALIFILLDGMYSGDLVALLSVSPLKLVAGYLLAAWAVMTGSVLLHEVHKRLERQKAQRLETQRAGS